MTTVPETGGRELPFGLSGSRIQLQEYTLVGVVMLLLIAGAVLEPDVFPTSDNILNVLRQSSVIGVLAIGMTFVIATGGIDLSVGSMVAAAAVAGGQFADSGSFAFLLGAIGMGVLLGGVNAGLIAYGKVVPFIATLAMFAMARGLALYISDKTPISIFDLEGVRWFGTGEVIGVPVGRARLPGGGRGRLDPAQPHQLRPPRRRRRRQPRGRADRGREGLAHHLHRLRDQRHLRGRSPRSSSPAGFPARRR